MEQYMQQFQHDWHGGLTSLAAIERFETEKTLQERIPKTVYQLFVDAAEKYKHKPALKMIMTAEENEQPAELSYLELLYKINQTANLFAEVAGVGAGVAYLLPSLLETQITLWAAETSGYAVPLNSLLNAEHLVDLIKSSQAKVLVVPGPTLAPQIWEKVDVIRTQCPDLKIIALAAPQDTAVIDFHQAISSQPKNKLTFSNSQDPDRVVAYFHTGGTTSAPKLVAHNHTNQLTAALGTAALLDIRTSDILTNGMPLFHVGGTIVCSLTYFLSGATVLILSPSGFRNPNIVQRFWWIVEHYQVTVIGAVPTALAAILAHPIHADLSRVRLALTGAAATPRTVAKQFIEKTGLSVHEILGMTEAGGATAIDPAGVEATMSCAGLRLPYTRVSIHQQLENGKVGPECAVNETGVLVVTGPTVSPGYLNVVQGIDNIVDGQLNSGDLAKLDSDGKLFLAGRAKDLIIRSGHNIDPALIEDVLTVHPAVAAAAAVGQPDTYAGERPVCFVTLKQGQHITPEELLAFAQQGISERPAWPSSIHIISELPMTAVGKIYKPALRAQAALNVITPFVQEVAGTSLIQVLTIDEGVKGFIIEVQISSSEHIDMVNEVLGRFTLASRVITLTSTATNTSVSLSA
jgi:fatty-acyl-CoA synthase